MELVLLGALIVVNLSGDQDGQEMLLHMICRLQLPVSQMVCIHADLGEADWEGTEDHARSQAEAFGIPFLVCRAHDKSGNDTTLIDCIHARGPFRNVVASGRDRGFAYG